MDNNPNSSMCFGVGVDLERFRVGGWCLPHRRGMSSGWTAESRWVGNGRQER